MDQEQAANALDPVAILRAAASDAVHAETSTGADTIANLLDLEERVVFDLTERVVPDGDQLVAAARGRHQAILDAVRLGGVTPDTSRLVEAHVRVATETLYPQLMDHLDPSARADLAVALERARRSRPEPGGRAPGARPPADEPPA